jgi:hypothetical protein
VTPEESGDPLAAGWPLHTTMSRLCAGIRATLAVVVLVVAVLGSARPVSPLWTVSALALLFAWTIVYVRVAYARGLSTWLVWTDTAVTGVLCLAMARLVPLAAVSGLTSWVSNLASMSVICGQLGGRPAQSIPAGLTVAACFLGGSLLADSPDNGVSGTVALIVQTFLTAAVLVVGDRAALAANAAFGSYHRALREAEVSRARRADERTHLRQLHNGPLTTLTVLGLGGLGVPDGSLRRRAADDLTTLTEIGAEVTGPLALDLTIASVAARYRPPLGVDVSLQSISVDAAVAAAFADAVAEALENVVRHAGTDRAELCLSEVDGQVTVTVADHGRGFEPDSVPAHRFGVRESIVGRLAEVGGHTSIQSSPGTGTRISMVWTRDD